MIRTYLKRFLARESSFLGRQQLYVLVFYTAAIFLGLFLNLRGYSGPQKDFNFWLNLTYIIVIAVLSCGYAKHWISLSHALCGVIIVTQLSTCTEMINCAFASDEYSLMLIVGNMVILMANIMFSLLAYLKYLPYLLCAMNIGVYLVCIRITGDASLANFAGVFFAIFAAVCVLGSQLVKNIRFLERENTTLKKDEEELFVMLGHNKEQVRAYMELAQSSHNPDKTAALLNMLGEKMQRNVVANVNAHLLRTEADMVDMDRIFPELSAAEREVCLLIIQDKKLYDICTILNKTESTITSTRTHIRRKLELQPADNLRKVLLERIKR